MEKLIWLLNEYNCNVLGCSDKREYKDYMGGLRLSSVGAWKIYLYVISKEYGFIKWLVENDKIDYKKLYEKEIESGWDFDGPKTNSEDLSIEFANQYNTEIALMLLSISDTPIEDLLLYLK